MVPRILLFTSSGKEPATIALEGECGQIVDVSKMERSRRPQNRKPIMISRIRNARGCELYRVPTTATLCDYPLLIGEILRRSDLRREKRARQRARIRQLKSMLALR